MPAERPQQSGSSPKPRKRKRAPRSGGAKPSLRARLTDLSPRARGVPSEAIRHGLVKRLAGPALDRLAPRSTHIAARIGPR